MSKIPRAGDLIELDAPQWFRPNLGGTGSHWLLKGTWCVVLESRKKLSRAPRLERLEHNMLKILWCGNVGWIYLTQAKVICSPE